MYYTSSSETSRNRFLSDLYGLRTIDELTGPDGDYPADISARELFENRVETYGLDELEDEEGNPISVTDAEALQVVNIRYTMGLSSYRRYEATQVTSYIDEHPGAAPSELAAYWSRTNGFISQILKKLEEKGFIIRTRSPQNAKRVLLYTTEKGKAFSYAHKRFDALNVSISMQRLLQSCSMEEVDAFYKVMDAYCDLFLKYGVEGIIPED